MRKLLIIIVLISLAFSCETESKLEKEIAKIDITVNVERFDKLFAEVTPKNLPELKSDYPFMFSKRYNDSVWIARINDTLQQQLNTEVAKAFPDESLFEDDIESLFQHLKYYFKAFKTPRIITVTSDVDYRNKTIVTDTIVLIALDTYLGQDHEFYVGIQNFIKQNFRSSQIVSDLATQYAQQQVYQPKRKSLLDEMIYFGKVLYFKDVMIPFKSDEEKIGYTKEQLDWALDNESYIWRYFVERELLFDTNPKLLERFINPAPFSKFNLELDTESPGRLGQYIGWQIVRAYMKNNDVDLQQMLNANAEDIFNKSKFKPHK
ncbi:MAG: gliding motility lipoprotein GldB [Flavobacteriaceae bacterium]|nr:gliding motility lipoprotein GldB [Flavobacteriaceae bacterium]